MVRTSFLVFVVDKTMYKLDDLEPQASLGGADQEAGDHVQLHQGRQHQILTNAGALRYH